MGGFDAEDLTGTTARLIIIGITALAGLGCVIAGGQGLKEKLIFIIVGGAIVFSATGVVRALFNK